MRMLVLAIAATCPYCGRRVRERYEGGRLKPDPWRCTYQCRACRRKRSGPIARPHWVRLGNLEEGKT